MLIAIMGDTYAKVSENKQRYSLMQKTEVYADFTYAINFTKKFEGKRYAYVITPASDGETDQWEGSLGRIRASMKKGHADLREMISEKVNDLTDEQRVLGN